MFDKLNEKILLLKKAFFRLFERIDSPVSFWLIVAGGVLAFCLTAFAAAGTAWLNPLGPVAWMIAGFVGFILFGYGLNVIGLLRSKWIDGNLSRHLYESGDKLNPLETTFEKLRIHISDILPPVGNEIADKTFVDCEIVGPANILMSGGTVQKNNGVSVDIVLARDDAEVHNGIVLKDCNISNCRFYLVTFLIPKAMEGEFNRGLSGANWVTYNPL